MPTIGTSTTSADTHATHRHAQATDSRAVRRRLATSGERPVKTESAWAESAAARDGGVDDIGKS
jgi:hypothetical protein